MKALLSAAAAAGLLFGISSVAIAASDKHEGDCGKSCSERHTPPPQAATPRSDAPSQGPRNAKVTVEVWSDFQCPYCARGAERVKELRAKYGDQVRIVFRHQPLPMHRNARLAASAAMAAHEQGKFWEMHDALFANQKALDRASLEKVAEGLKLDMHRFRKALDTGAYNNYLDAEQTEAQRRGVAGTPTFFINDTPVVGARGIEEFTQVIDGALGKR
ncbi:DsbA family protein [Myxococcaceae bacterium GXIMD 01537]